MFARRAWLLCLILIFNCLAACQPTLVPTAQPRFRQQSQPAASDALALSEKQYIQESTRIIQESLQAGDREALEQFMTWGETQAEHFPGSRDAIARQLMQPSGRSASLTSGGMTRADRARLQAMVEKPVAQAQFQAYRPIDFSLDQGNHPAKLAEWWYYNGHLQTSGGRNYGYELCFFRVAPVIYFVHMAITDEQQQKFTYLRRFVRPSKVALQAQSGDVAYGGTWAAQQLERFKYRIQGTVESFKLDLTLSLVKQPLIINGDGLIDMPEGTDSYYYSLTRLQTEGTLQRGSETEQVTGQSWFDHQWGNFVAWRIGWDWFSFQMDDGSEYNLFGFRKRSGQPLKRYVNIQGADNQSQHGQDFRIERLAWWKSPATGKLYVTKWRVYVPQTQETFEVEAVNPDQEVAAKALYDLAPTYWEGRCRVTKFKADGSRVQGLSYVEHFDYARPIGAD